MATRIINLSRTTTISRLDSVPLAPSSGEAVKRVLVEDLVRAPEYTIATLPTPSADRKRDVAYVSDGASGAAVMAFCDGVNWRRLDTLATLA
ncbi:hypothetical protein [uncultured Paraglaciecola sp.]|uniref:hypothetical protein n=1 Tax=uncultured Paraglaciecola sp. TaxID=1765024 RepID=UPI0026088594|nr:hypothetical protein [uncultured Paraglaciecola sp.]